jgi:hypothetical protein
VSTDFPCITYSREHQSDFAQVVVSLITNYRKLDQKFNQRPNGRLKRTLGRTVELDFYSHRQLSKDRFYNRLTS